MVHEMVFACTLVQSSNHFVLLRNVIQCHLNLVGYNKQFLYASVGAPYSDAKMIKSTHIYREILNGKVISNRKLHLESGGEISLITVGDSAFSRYLRLLKVYNEETLDPQQRYLKKKLYSVRVVTENAHGMLKGR